MAHAPQTNVANPTLDISATPSPSEIAVIEEGLTVFNRQAYPHAGDREPLCVFVRDADGAVIGGATGHTRWGWLYVDCFWLPEEARQGGLGGKILLLAETEAARRGCTRACLFTYRFQAQGFYEKHGYRVFGIQEDYPPGQAKIWMSKQLATPLY